MVSGTGGAADKRCAVRKLGSIETRMALFCSNLNGSTQGVQIIRFNGDLWRTHFYTAVERLYSSYEALQCSIRKVRDEGLWFYRDVELSEVPVQLCEVSTEADLEPLISSAVDTPLDAERSLWRLALVSIKGTSRHAMILTAHHAIIDANGMHELADSFLRILSALNGSEVAPELHIWPLPLPVDDLLRSYPVPPTSTVPEQRKHEVRCPVSHRRTAWQTVSLTNDQLDALNKKLKLDNIKFHSLISAALSKAFYSAGLVESNFNFGTAITLRFLQSHDTGYLNPLGCYMTISSNQVDPATKDVLALARDYEKDLMHKMMTSCLNRTETSFDSFMQVTQSLAELDTFSQGAGITNMGKVGIAKTYGDLEVTDYAMLANRAAANFSIVAHCYEFRGKQTIDLVYPTPCLNDKTVMTVAESLSKILFDYISGGSYKISTELSAIA